MFPFGPSVHLLVANPLFYCLFHIGFPCLIAH
ncbi:hypothetical protein T01_11018 [Trichinella spiralis]|uniref:Uncharacterized protein n=1 Tax=Trichinella spiralis TaxID=6334 RepID=A0A0V0Z220_TRISP|nr:hypothetical protein T01_11018 [Trichinella spiralis]